MSETRREAYVSDLGFPVLGAPGLIVGTLSAAIVCGFLLQVLFQLGWYFVIVFPCLLAMALGGIYHWLVAFSHCRNHWFVGLFGASAGVVAYLSYFQFGMMSVLPPQIWHRVDLLPRYVVVRMGSDVQIDAGKANGNEKPNVFMNWFAFAIEGGAFVCIVAVMGWKRSRRAYLPDLRLWSTKESKRFALGLGAGLKQAMESDTLAEFVQQAAPSSQQNLASHFDVEWFEVKNDTPFNYPIYGTISDHRSSLFILRQFRHTLVRQVQLTTSEVLKLRPILPKLSNALAENHPEIQDLPSNVYLSSPPSSATAFAQVTSVPEMYRQRVRDKNYALIVNLLGGVELLIFFGGLGALLGGMKLISGHELALGWTLVAFGGLCVIEGIYVSQFCMGARENRWIHRRLRREIGSRPDAIVDMDDPEVRYVTIIPRQSFEQVKWTMSSDLLLMFLDERRREIRMEGDCDRYVIPAEAILVCEPVCFFHPIDIQKKTQLWIARLIVQREMGTQEILLSIGRVDWWPRTNSNRKKRCIVVCQEIEQLRQPT